MYCGDWLSENEWFDIRNISSQRVSDLLGRIGESDRNKFFKTWYTHIKEREYIALDITSVSSYSKNRDECEYGYNRDGEHLPQTNICMLFGETSKLPVYQTMYSGSLGDVSTLECTISQFHALFGDICDVFIMDKGFFSKKNVDMMIEKGARFLLSVPFSNGFARKMVEHERTDIDNQKNTIITSKDPIRGVCREHLWGKHKLYAHVYYNLERHVKEKNDLFLLIHQLKNAVRTGQYLVRLEPEISRYLKIDKTESGCTIAVREDAVARSLETAGWFVLISNHIENFQHAYDVYRMKDVVENGFWKYKNNLGLDRLRVHSDEKALNKTFIAFISLILSSYIQKKTLKNCQKFSRLPLDRLFLILAKPKSVRIGRARILRPMTKQQNDLFEAFGISKPVG